MKNSFFNAKNIVIISLMLALATVLDMFSTIYISPSLKLISFSYLPGIVISILHGPIMALIYGLLSDTLLYFVNSHGEYFYGYAISKMITFFVYALFLHKKPHKIWRILVAKILNKVIVVFGLNYVWSSMLFGSIASTYFTKIRLVNNLIQFPLHCFLIILIDRYLKNSKFIKNRV
ncbi:MAG: folate family ECF transporter S component [Candidatus Paraimprobicoccus trichonymphae]|uniref:Folate family ECF transporter S component n=1 Tax=Candidatus Paraimprobicoccus trichonymphae TaxID=3033793 RepID=A0AA48KW29_9FIRM|nr:MAG: folate family ECF transporter S component [Candidatus Paraimprobicoccus trichonymphae]